jgi:hypothetical protein
MIKFNVTLMTAALFALAITGCQNETGTEQSTSAKQEPAEQTDKTSAQDATNADGVIVPDAQQRQKVESQRKLIEEQKNKVTSDKNNTISPYRYITSTEEFSNLAVLLEKSTLRKHVHNAGITFLAPNNDALNAYPEWRQLAESGSTDEIDVFLANYIVDEKLSRKQVSAKSKVLTHSGAEYGVSNESELTVGRVALTETEVITDNGIVLELSDLYYEP